MPASLVCEIFRCSKRAEMYLYVDKGKGTAELPQALLASLGNLQSVMMLRLHEDRHLARADVQKVMEAIGTQGFYLQMPPAEPGVQGRV